jgi:hypothetical protein
MSSEAYAKITAYRDWGAAEYEQWLTGVLDRLTR